MMQWSKVPFSELLVESRDGEWGEGAEKVGHQLCEVIRGTDFADLYDAKKELPQRWIPDHLVARKRLQLGDLLLETAGGTAKQSTGRSALLRQSFFSLHKEYPVLCSSFARHLRLDATKYSPDLIYYLLQALYQAGYMAVFNLQHTGVSRFQFTAFKNKAVLDIPNLATQQKIAAILSAYDDLIENNRRRIALLEKIAEEIYREWFVRLRFPGHEQAKVEKGVPVGWSRKKLPELATITYGFPFDAQRFNSIGLGRPIIRIRNIANSATQDFTDEVADEKYIVRKGDLLIGMDGEFHINHWQGDDAYLVQRSCRIKPKHAGISGYLALALRAPIKHFESTIVGATVGHLGAKHLNSIEILVPPAPIAQHLQVFNDLLAQKIALSSATNKLASARDALLPRLISGKLPVDALDIRFPSSMQLE